MLGLGWTKAKCILSEQNWTELGMKGFMAHILAFQMVELNFEDYYYEVPSPDEFIPRVLTGNWLVSQFLFSKQKNKTK